MSTRDYPYSPSSGPVYKLPLARFLPPLAFGMASRWLRREAEVGKWLLDPLGSHPMLAIEAARAGYRVLVACNNPVLAFLLETLAAGLQLEDFQSGVAALASQRRGEERLETQVQSFYRTTCRGCETSVLADSYLWQKEADRPQSVQYRCPNCGSEGEFPLEPEDQQVLERIRGAPLARALAVERLGIDQPADRPAVEEAMSLYRSRPLSVLFTLINKSVAIDLSPNRRRALQALLLQLCDEANSLWPDPPARLRPRQPTTPARFREANLWAALERGPSIWHTPDFERVELTRWPDLPAGPGICLFAGRARELFPLPPGMDIRAVVSVFSRPNPAFLTLSTLWSGWLWGRESVQPMRSVLERQRFDWYWHAGALDLLFSHLRQNLPAGVKMLALASEANPSLLLSLLAAARTAGFQVEGLALRNDEETAQVLWRSGMAARTLHSNLNWQQILSEAAESYLQSKAEPAAYLQIVTAGLSQLVEQQALPLRISEVRSELNGAIQNTLNLALANPSRFQQFGEGGAARWSAVRQPVERLPLADRVEMEAVRFLQKNYRAARHEVDEELCARFPGLTTPPGDLVLHCLESYAALQPDGTVWELGPGENPAQRRLDLEQAAQQLAELGQRLGFSAQAGSPLVWLLRGMPRYAFYLLSSAVISRFVYKPVAEGVEPVLVLPGGRAGLLAYKLQRDPRLNAASQRWHFLKLRHLRRLFESNLLTGESWKEQLDFDPPAGEDLIQLRMF